VLDEPELSVKTVECWVFTKKIRTYRFGNTQVTAKSDELVEDLTPTPANAA
jgi:hypothetical protein